MLTREENEMITRVGPGTPAGELLRRYWFPVGVASELTAESPTQIVRILGETLVLFRDKKGNVGLLNDRCAHRGASLCYGRVEERGIACPYHGWLYDTKGNCLEKILSGAKISRSLLGLSGATAAAADPQLRCLVPKGWSPKNLHSTATRLQLVSSDGEFHGPGASADSPSGYGQSRPAD